jgi:hypothetical protein
MVSKGFPSSRPFEGAAARFDDRVTVPPGSQRAGPKRGASYSRFWKMRSIFS